MQFSSARCALVIWMAIAGISPTAQTPRAESDQDVLIGLERGWNDAVYQKDLAFIETSRKLAGLLKHFDLFPKSNGTERGYNVSRHWVKEWRSRYERQP